MDLVERIAKLSPEQRRLLELTIKQKNLDISQIPISQEYRKNYNHFPLSFEQEPMWFIEQFEPNNATYDIFFAIGLEGNLNKEAFERSINEIIKRHEILRTVFIIAKDKPMQVILPTLYLPLTIIDFKGLPGDEQDARLNRLREDKGLHMFDLVKGPLIKAELIELSEHKHIFLYNMHHMISDIISTQIFFRELAWFYKAFTQGEVPAPSLPALNFQYVDYACWQRRWFQENKLGIEARKKEEEFWLGQFSGEIPILNLPTDYPRPAVKSREADQLFLSLNEEEVGNLKEVAVKYNTTLYVVLLSSLYVFLAKLSGQEDIVIGTPISSRKGKALNNMIGLFTRTLALRNYPLGGKLFSEFLADVNACTLEAYRNQDYQYEELVAKLLVERDLGRNPLFDVIYNFSYIDTSEVEIYGLKMESLTWKNKHTGFDIDIQSEGTYKEILFKLAYNIKLFKEDTIRRVISYYKKIMRTAGKNPGLKISDMEILPEEEKRKILLEYNNVKKNLVRDKNYARLFEEQTAKSPAKIAAVYAGHHITYSELNEDSGRIARLLSQHGTGVNKIILLYLKRSIKMLASILGVFKTGAAYLPLEIDYPNSRIKFILENSEAGIAVTDGDRFETLYRMRPSLPRLKEVLCLDHEKKVEIFDQDLLLKEPLIEKSRPDDLAYLIYTSGTTGKPKGVMIHQLGMQNHLYAKINDLSITCDDIIAQTASACFDISVWQFLAAILVGGTTAIIDKEVTLDSVKFFRVLQLHRVTILESVPSLLIALLEGGTQDGANLNLKWMLSTGEPLTPPLVEKWYNYYPGVKLVNAYGPTEASDDITHYIVPVFASEIQTTVPIGKPLQNFHIYILDKYLSLCPIGVRGEICVAGIGVGKGYWKDNEKTEAAFVPNPYVAGEGNEDYKVLYKTGDLGYFRPDGNVECLGRLDSQVKIRGNRIELGEIESQLLKHEEIKEAVVVIRTVKKDKPGSESGDRYLCAYVVPHHEIRASELKNYLSDKMPEYMVPSYFIPLAELPLTPNGKIDRKALPEPAYENCESAKEYIAPANEIEARLAGIWSELLAIEAGVISTGANFFEIGGHSLKATGMAAVIRKEFNVDIPLVELFKASTIQSLAEWIKKKIANE